VGKYYGTYDAHHIFREFEPGELEITPMFYDHAFFCTRAGTWRRSRPARTGPSIIWR